MKDASDARRSAAVPAAVRLRWLRMLAVATTAMLLASCRGLPLTAVVSTAAVSDAAMLVEDGAAAPAAVVSRVAEATTMRDPQVTRTGLEAPCPALPRIGGGCGPGCGSHALRARVGHALCPSGNCGPACPPPVCMACEAPPPPVVGPYLVGDGGDAYRPARAVGENQLANLTAGDTVARFRPADEMPDSVEVRLVASNCACVFAPRFGAVREVTRPLEGARPEGPRGLSLDTGVELEETLQPVCGKTQSVALEAARKSLPGVAVQERLGPLAVDQGDMPREDDGLEGPVERVRDEQPELERLRQRPLVQVGFDVPITWTCIKAANVLLNDQAAEVVAVDRGTATLRFEEPGRAELTLCKRAGSDTARAGEELDFTIFMLNSGDRPLTGVVLADALPTRLDYIPDSAAASVPADFTTETGDDGSVVLTWRLEETLKPGESGFVRFRTIVK